jgi:hypothetical protein
MLKTNGNEHPTKSIHRMVLVCHLHYNAADESPGSDDERSCQKVDGGADWRRTKTRLEIDWKVVYAEHQYLPSFSG